MTPRERVRAALSHKEPDRMPVDNNGFVSSIHEVAYANLLRQLDRREEAVILDPVQRIVLASEEVMKRLGVDTRYLYPQAPSSWRYEEKQDGTWDEDQYTGTGFPKYFMIKYHIYRNCFPLSALGAYRQLLRSAS